MQLAISYLSYNGTVEAFVLGHPEWRAVGKSKVEAEGLLQKQVQDRIRAGELKFLEVEGPSTFAGRAAVLTDEDRREWAEVTAEIYRERDAEKAAEFPECL